MGYSFPGELAEKVRRRMDSGKYRSEDDLVSAALKALDEHDRHVEKIRQKIEAGFDQLDQGLGVPLDLDGFLERVNAKHRSNSNAE